MEQHFAIFDLDGTLVDSIPIWRRVDAEYLAEQGVLHPPADLGEIVKPMTLVQSSAYFVRELGLPGTPEQVREEISRRIGQHYRTDIPLKPGVAGYLQVLRDRGVAMAVASATAVPLVDACLRRLGVRDCFRVLVSCEDVGTGTQRPDVYLEAARRLGAPLRDTAVYEDSWEAACTARRAGAPLVAVYDESGAERWAELCALAQESILDWGQAARREAARTGEAGGGQKN